MSHLEIIKEIEAKVLTKYPNITAEELKGSSKQQKYYVPRNFICIYARDRGVTVQALGDYYNRIPSTITQNTNKFRGYMYHDLELSAIDKELQQELICEHVYTTYTSGDTAINVCDKCDKLIRL